MKLLLPLMWIVLALAPPLAAQTNSSALRTTTEEGLAATLAESSAARDGIVKLFCTMGAR